jgi:Zn-dependent peptidase ImmA (M78 family)
VRAQFEQAVVSEQRFDVRALILLAHQFGVATEAMCRRLEELELLSQRTWDSLRDRGWAAALERNVVGEAREEPKPSLVPTRLAYLASIALDNGALSEGQLCELLAVDRAQLREALAPFDAREVIPLNA